MNNLVHIVFGDSACGNLKYYFSQYESELEGKIFNFRDDFSIGPLSQMMDSEVLKRRAKYFKDMFSEVYQDDECDYITPDFFDIYQHVQNIADNMKVVIWYGDNTNDQTGLRYITSIIKNQDIYGLNVSNIVAQSGRVYRSLAELEPKDITNCFGKFETIDSLKRHQLANEWLVLARLKKSLRVLQNGQIKQVEDDYFDNQILKVCGLTYRRAARIIGETMGKADQLVGDVFIGYRLLQLVKRGIVDYRGSLVSMRSYEVKKKETGKDYFQNIFQCTPIKDQDGIYHVLLEETKAGLDINVTDINQWPNLDMTNKLIVDYTDDSFFAFTWRKEGRVIMALDMMAIKNIDFIESEAEKYIKIHVEKLYGYYIRMTLKPWLFIGICMEN